MVKPKVLVKTAAVVACTSGFQPAAAFVTPQANSWSDTQHSRATTRYGHTSATNAAHSIARIGSVGGGSALAVPVAIAAGAAIMTRCQSKQKRRTIAMAVPLARPIDDDSEQDKIPIKKAPPPFDPAKQLGVTDPLGFFDPLGFSKAGDQEGFYKLRSSELKHGRVAMMAALGAVVQHYVQIPGFEDVPKGLGAVSFQGFFTPIFFGVNLLFLTTFVFELLVWADDPTKGVDGIGDCGNPIGALIDSKAGPPSRELKNRELNNGRAAMFAALGIIAAELYTGKDAIEQFGFA